MVHLVELLLPFFTAPWPVLGSLLSPQCNLLIVTAVCLPLPPVWESAKDGDLILFILAARRGLERYFAHLGNAH